MFSRSVIIIISVLILSASPVTGGKEYSYQFQKMINVDPPLELTINNANGNVIIKTNTEDRLKVDAVKRVYADSKDEADLVADHVQISVARAGGHFTIEPKFLRIQGRSLSFWDKLLGKSGEPSYGAVDFIVSVPTDCNIDVYNTSGNIDASGIKGKVFLSGSGGDISVRDIQGRLDITMTSGKLVLTDIDGNIHINATGSDVSFYAINGDLEIRKSSGKTIGESLIGDLTLSQTTGTIDLKYIEGNLRIKSTSGRITVDQDFGALDISSESGNIIIKTELNSSQDYYVETISGSIKFNIPGTSSGIIRMEAASGDIDTKIPILIESFSKTRISGHFGNEGPKISLATTSGDITLAEY